MADLLGLMLSLEWAGRLLPVAAPSLGVLFVVLVSATTLVTLYVLEAYIPDKRNRGARMALKTALGVILSAGMVVVGADTAYTLGFARALPDGMLVLAFGLFLLWALVVRLVLVFLTYCGEDRELWGVIGDPAWVSELQDAAGPGKELRYLGRLPEVGDSRTGNPVVSGNIRTMLAGRSFSGVIVATDEAVPGKLVDYVKASNGEGLWVLDCMQFYERHLYKVPVSPPAADGSGAVPQNLFPPIQRIQVRLKRVIDVMLSMTLLIVTSPVLLVVSLLIRIDSPGPVIYRQVRVGENGRTFELYKFRTMIDQAEADGPVWTDEADPRITRAGKYLRITRIDELPQFWNVLINDMSLVGPRAERPEFVQWLAKEIPCYDQRHLVKPGITGWAQVMYKYGSTLDDARRKLEYDLFYIKYFSLMLDTLIFLRTIRVMLFVRGR